jgi:SAM-dependent methyltransferase
MPLAPEHARRVYDRIGRAQDTQAFYEDAATSRLAELGAFAKARSVFELGCGTGRYAAGLLREWLAPDARYLGVDVSPRMVALARDRLRGWAPRAEVALLGPPGRELPGADGGFDRFVATYVFDLLADEHAQALLAEAHRLLEPGGVLCVAGLTEGVTRAGRVVSGAWAALARRRPALLGGCRPIELERLLAPACWRVERREVITRWGVPSEVVLAAARDPGRDDG